MKLQSSKLIISSLVISILISVADSGNVLVICALSSPSHKNVFEPFVSALAKKGHEVTFVSAYKASQERKNVREVMVLPGYDYFPNMNTMDIRRYGIRGMLAAGTDHIYEACHKVFKHSEFQEVLQKKFDVILFDMIGNECLYGVVHALGSPLIVVSTLPAPNAFTSMLGNRLPPSFVTAMMLSYPDTMNFFQRVINVMMNIMFDVLIQRERASCQNLYRQYLGQDVPSIPEILGNTSLLLMNSHFTLNYPRPTLPDVVEVGGGHCRPGKPLPKHIQDFVSGAENGFIFFSLGSIVKPHELTDDIRQVFLNTFRKLPYRVLWKWAEETMPKLPENVKLLKWVPQQDVLAQPNIKLFMTHGGLLSLQEAVYHGVPVIGVPIFGDQDLNAEKARQVGMGETIEILDVTEDVLEATIKKVISPEYKDRVQNLSALFRDRNHNPVEDAVYWTEYIMRHKGAPHLRSAARNLNFFQYYSLDVIGFLSALLALVSFLLLRLVKGIYRRFCCATKRGENKKNK